MNKKIFIYNYDLHAHNITYKIELNYLLIYNINYYIIYYIILYNIIYYYRYFDNIIY